VGYRGLSAAERRTLESQGCESADWGQVLVAEPFAAARVRRVRFSGQVRIGRLEGEAELPGGGRLSCGLYDSRIHDCTLGDGVLVADARWLAGYDLEEGVQVLDVGLLAMEGQSSFGNGTRLELLNEAGGRSLLMHDRLSAQEAYLAVMHRHRPALSRALEALAEARAASRRSARGAVRHGSRILRCTAVRNVEVGPYAVLSGAALLEEGTVRGSAEDPAEVGAGVQARHFIILSGSRVEGGSELESCFVGQGVLMRGAFAAENCAFFANSECFNGEAVAVFAGPYTVTHHRSTLLIGASVSFFNAGSGTNQSNHLYKLGPVHQGILERGAKTGSNAYLLWPARVGPFSTVVGQHRAGFDAADLPFSHIGEEGGRTVITAGVNLVNVGSRRDAEKWPARDRRRDPQKLDLLSHGRLNPFTVGRLRRGLELLLRLLSETPQERELVSHGGAHLRRLMLKRSARFYEQALEEYLGERLAARLESLPPAAGLPELRQALAEAPGAAGGRGEWWDLAGLVAPAAQVQALESELEGGRVGSLEELAARFAALQAGGPEQEWAWCRTLLEERLGVGLEQAAPSELARVLEAWREAAAKSGRLVLADAAREFDERARTAFGCDGGPAEREADFAAVRGRLEDQPTVRRIEEEMQEVGRRAERLLAWLAGLAPEGRRAGGSTVPRTPEAPG
jgi:hypothetical protein